MSNLCISMTFKWKKNHWKIRSHIFYNLTWMSFYFIFHLYMWYTKTISINLYACTIAQYTVKIVTNKRATKHERNVDPSRTCINRQRQNTSKTHAKIWYVNIYLEIFFILDIRGGGGSGRYPLFCISTSIVSLLVVWLFVYIRGKICTDRAQNKIS